MLMSMNVFHQTTTPKLLNFPSVSCHGRGRRSSSSHFLVSSPATTMEFNSKFLNIHSSPKTIGFNPKSLHFLPCHGFSHSSCKPVLASPSTMKFGSVLFALPRDDEEEPVIQEHGEEHHSSISSDNIYEKQSNKLEVEVREVTHWRDIWASAWLKAQVYHEDRLHESSVGKDMGKYTQQETDMIQRRYKDQTKQPYMCIIAVRKFGENERNETLEDVIGTLDFSGETYPEELVTETKIKTSKSKQRKSRKYGIISKMTVAKSARRQGVGSRMLKFAIEAAKDKGIEQVFLDVNGDNKPALALCEKMGVPILELPRENEEFSSDNKEETKIQEHEQLRLRTYFSSDKQLKKVSGGELKKQEFSITVATHDTQFWSSAFLRSELSEDESHPRIIEEFNAIKTQYIMRAILPYMCIIVVRKEGENVLNGMRKNGVGTLDFCVKLYPDQEVVSAKMIKTFKQRESPTYGIISKVAVHKSARQQGVGSLMLKSVIEFARKKGISQLFLQVHRRNKPAQALFGKMGFTITDARVTPLQEKPNMYTCSLDL